MATLPSMFARAGSGVVDTAAKVAAGTLARDGTVCLVICLNADEPALVAQASPL